MGAVWMMADNEVREPPTSSFSNDRKIGSRQATIFFIAFGNLHKSTVNSNKACANLREIPEDVSVRKPPLKEEARRQRTLTLENDELYPSFSNDRKIGSRQATIFLFVSSLIQTLRATRKSAPGGFFIAFGNLPKVSVDFGEARANLREIPEDASVRKPPLKEEARRQRTLTLENDGVVVFGLLFVVCCCWFVLSLPLGSKKQ